MSGVSGDSLAVHRPVVRGLVLRHVGDEALAEEITQETYLRVQRATAPYRGEASERSWLCAIALNVVRDHFRRAGRIPETTYAPEVVDAVGSDEDGEHALLESEMAACIGEFLVQLPSAQHQVLALYDMVELSHAEIADLLGISVANSRVLLHRGRVALRALLKENCVLSFGDAVPCERRSSSRKCE